MTVGPLKMADEFVHEVAVIGAGVVGCAVARLLTVHGASVVVLERSGDVGALGHAAGAISALPADACADGAAAVRGASRRTGAAAAMNGGNDEQPRHDRAGDDAKKRERLAVGHAERSCRCLASTGPPDSWAFLASRAGR